MLQVFVYVYINKVLLIGHSELLKCTIINYKGFYVVVSNR